MALITNIDLVSTLEDARSVLLAAANGDGIVSRADLKDLLQQTEDPTERRFLEFFYGFILKLENRPRTRVTEEAIDSAIAFILEQIIPKFEIKEQFTRSTHQKIAQTHEAAFPMAMELIRATSSTVLLSPREVSEQITPLTEGLFFDDYGSEAAMDIFSFFLEHTQPVLSPESFVEALGVDPNTPKGKVERFESADSALLTFVEQHMRLGLSNQARTVVELMQANLSDLKVIIIGEDNHPDLESNHPVYVTGMGQDNHLAGFESRVIWT